MSAVRRHLRVYVAVWLAFQAAALSAVVPRECCAAHRAAPAKVAADCHEPAAPVPQDAHAHHGAAAAGSEAAPGRSTPDDDTCSIRGACGGPMAGFLAQLSLHGVLAARPQLAPDVAGTNLECVAHEHLVSRLAAPDSPPPRA